MTVEVLASGSSGNCTALTAGDKFLLVDCGKPIKWTLAKLNYRLPDAIFVTHEHSDHSKAAKNFLQRGVDVFLTEGTRKALGIDHYNAKTITVGETICAAGFKINVLPSIHDAAEPVNFIVSDDTDRTLYVTDTGAIPNVDGDFTKILIEANYSEPLLLKSDLDARQKRRILERHLSIEQTENFLKRYPKAKVTLIHLSKRHGDVQDFYRRIKQCQSAQK